MSDGPRMRRLAPFFSYYGSKHRIAGLYPPPETGRIIEPFAGSAAYACRYPALDVLLIDANPKVAGVWDFLIRASADEIIALPLLNPDGTVDASGICEEAVALIGYWLSKGAAHPPAKASAWGRNPEYAAQFWGEGIRERVARQVGRIRHWKVRCANYWEAPDVGADWFIDPPYQGKAGRHYRRFGSHRLDFASLGNWCVERRGHVIICENVGADWLPFRPFHNAAGMQGTLRSGISREAIFHRSTEPQRDLFVA